MSSSPGPASDVHRACAHCRSQKVRCIPDESNPDVCQRCARAGRACVFTPLQKKKQRKRTDTRVAELEREMRAMRTMLKSKQEAPKTSESPSETSSAHTAGLWYNENVRGASRELEWSPGQAESAVPPEMQQQQREAPQPWTTRFEQHPARTSQDVVDRGILSMGTAQQLFNTYRNDLLSHYPMVPLPSSVTADEMRETNSTLFLAIIAAAAARDNPDLSVTLDQEVLQVYATRILVQSEKSLELVQSLIISASWYHPPTKYDRLKYYEYLHMAATMAIDIGIATRPVQHRSRFRNQARGREPMPMALEHPGEENPTPDLSMTPGSQSSTPDTGSVESRRTFLACYVICTGVSLSTRRPNMLRASSYTRECVESMEHESHTLLSDRALTAWVRLSFIAEEISTSFSYDDLGSIASITELRAQLMLKDFEKRLTAWYSSVPEVDMNGCLAIMYHTTRIHLHEIALHVDHSPEDFRVPYQMGCIHPFEGVEVPTQILADAIAKCMQSAHGLLNAFLAMRAESLRALPVYSFAKVFLAAFVLAKLCVSASSAKSRIGRVLDRSSLKLEYYLDRTVLHVRNIYGYQRLRIPAIFLGLLVKLRQWCLNPEVIEQPDSDSDTTYPRDKSPRRPEDGFQKVTPSVEGPRVNKQMNSTENPLMESAAGQAAGFESVTGLTAEGAYSKAAHYASPSSSTDSGAVSKIGTQGVTGPGGLAPGSINIPLDAQYPTGDVVDQLMDLDKDFMQQFLGEMDASFPEGGLPGLDDWASLPTNHMLGQTSDTFNWLDLPGDCGSVASV